MTPLAEARGLGVAFHGGGRVVQVLHGIDLAIAPGETVGLVGESGSGKSVTALALMGLIAPPGRVVAGEVLWEGRSLLGTPGLAAGVRGARMAMVFQDPMTALNPLLPVGTQVAEVVRRHQGLGRAAARARASELLELVGIADPARRLDQLPHELSGGMRQRVVIAAAIACDPALLIADEPTTALDVTIQAQILELLAGLQARLGLAVLMITHDLGVVAATCRRIVVMYAGRVVEEGPAEAVFARPAHPYTAGLLRATPDLDVVQARMKAIPGAPPDMALLPAGCGFRPRCPIAVAACAEPQALIAAGAGRAVRCHRAFEPAWAAA